MSKLKEMKKSVEAKPSFGWLYTLLGAAIILGGIAFLYLALFNSSQPVDLAKLEAAGHSKGNPDAKVRIVEFSDFQCPACGIAYPTVKKIFEEFSSEIYFTYRHFPLRTQHPFAQKAAEASECAAEQGKFWEMHDALFENQQNLKVDDLKSYASGMGLDSEKFNACLASGKLASKVSADFSAGTALGVNSTPTFFINGQKYSNLSYDEFKAIIASKK